MTTRLSRPLARLRRRIACALDSHAWLHVDAEHRTCTACCRREIRGGGQAGWILDHMPRPEPRAR